LDVIQSYNSSNINSDEQYDNFINVVDFADNFLKTLIKREFIAAKE
jgi:hypothetical protein